MSVHNKFYFMVATMRPPSQTRHWGSWLWPPSEWWSTILLCWLRPQQAESATGSGRNTPGGRGNPPPVNQGHVPSHVSVTIHVTIATLVVATTSGWWWPQVISGKLHYCFAGRGQQAGSATGSGRNIGGKGNPPPKSRTACALTCLCHLLSLYMQL
jgi:hypothetical protein